MKIDKLINPNNKLFKWGPIDGRPIYPDYWHRGFVVFSKKYKPGWPPFIVHYQKDRVLAIGDWQDLYDNGEKIFTKYILDDKEFKKAYQKWENLLEDLKKIIKIMQPNDLKKLESKELCGLFLDWNKLYGVNFWDIGSLPELANWGGEQLLSRELKKRIKGEENFHWAMERLSAPEDSSFYQKEELDLLPLRAIKNKRSLEERLKIHQEKYFWLLNSYHHTKILTVGYFKKVLFSHSLEDARKKIMEINKLRREAVLHKKEIIKKFNLPKEILKIGRRLSFCIWWQDIRKSYIFQANHIIDIFLKEIGKRAGIGFNDLHYYGVKELERLMENGQKISNKEINKRKSNLLAVYDSEAKDNYLSGTKALEAIKPFINHKTEKGIKEFKGLVVNRGKVKGIARIIQSPSKIGKMKKGDILVASMTSPDYILALKKAAAVVTDEGGMTCHAAIVSRELKIPGIVGAKIATKVLKDGDLVEVDAERGIVKILNH